MSCQQWISEFFYSLQLLLDLSVHLVSLGVNHKYYLSHQPDYHITGRPLAIRCDPRGGGSPWVLATRSEPEPRGRGGSGGRRAGAALAPQAEPKRSDPRRCARHAPPDRSSRSAGSSRCTLPTGSALRWPPWGSEGTSGGFGGSGASIKDRQPRGGTRAQRPAVRLLPRSGRSSGFVSPPQAA